MWWRWEDEGVLFLVCRTWRSSSSSSSSSRPGVRIRCIGDALERGASSSIEEEDGDHSHVCVSADERAHVSFAPLLVSAACLIS
mmetsp:Transcript_7872/g.12515  ORF Transcript_7872/g.12515 Transcript_7872/m.12515 type:complete len:84 (-) Transcript_7872:330-581(-)